MQALGARYFGHQETKKEVQYTGCDVYPQHISEVLAAASAIERHGARYPERSSRRMAPSLSPVQTVRSGHAGSALVTLARNMVQF